MWRTNILIFGLLLAVVSCKSTQMTEAEQMQPAIAEEVEQTRSAKNHDGPSTAVDAYSLPHVMEVVTVDGKLKLKLRLNGKCEVHRFNWVKKGDCIYELQDHTHDKCMGYQFVMEEVKMMKGCNSITVNGYKVTYP